MPLEGGPLSVAKPVLAPTGHGDSDRGGFDAREPLHAPSGVGDLTHDFPFDVILGDVRVLEQSEVTVKLGGIFAGDDGVGGEKAVLEGVLGGTRLALGCAWSGGLFCVFAICL